MNIHTNLITCIFATALFCFKCNAESADTYLKDLISNTIKPEKTLLISGTYTVYSKLEGAADVKVLRKAEVVSKYSLGSNLRYSVELKGLKTFSLESGAIENTQNKNFIYDGKSWLTRTTDINDSGKLSKEYAEISDLRPDEMTPTDVLNLQDLMINHCEIKVSDPKIRSIKEAVFGTFGEAYFSPDRKLTISKNGDLIINVNDRCTHREIIFNKQGLLVEMKNQFGFCDKNKLLEVLITVDYTPAQLPSVITKICRLNNTISHKQIFDITNIQYMESSADEFTLELPENVLLLDRRSGRAFSLEEDSIDEIKYE